eukprot:2074035-Prymnesium_polylepis.1
MTAPSEHGARHVGHADVAWTAATMQRWCPACPQGRAPRSDAVIGSRQMEHSFGSALVLALA